MAYFKKSNEETHPVSAAALPPLSRTADAVRWEYEGNHAL